MASWLTAAWMAALCSGAGTAALAAESPNTAEALEDRPIATRSINSEPVWQTSISPAALAVSMEGKRLFIACATANKIAVLDTVSQAVTHRFQVPASPAGMALSADGSRLYVACAAPESVICILDTATGRILRKMAGGHTAMAPVLSPDGARLYVCNRFDNDVSVFDLASHRKIGRIPVEREPVAAAITPDGRLLVVANHLHAGSANHLHIAAAVSVIDTETLRVRKNINLALGASFLKSVSISPNGRFAAVPHVRSTYWLSTTGIELGRMNANALSVLDLEKLEVLGMVFLDQTTHGAANPSAAVWTPDGDTILVAHAGAHALSLVDAPLAADRACFTSARIGDYEPTEMQIAPLPKHRPVRLRQRLALTGEGPRALALAGSTLYIANYFSDNLCQVNLAAANPRPVTLSLGRVPPPSLERKGQRLFNDARICYQGWQSCASCHDSDARTDALNWDLLNDGVANPKNTRSLLWAHQSGPAMALGVRTNAVEAVRAGIQHILFSDSREKDAAAIDVYLQSLKPVPSPHLRHGRLSNAAQRGKQIFLDARTGCSRCHPPPLFTDATGHDVGTATRYVSLYGTSGKDRTSDLFYSPPLVELWRTAPYLHDGSALTLREVITANHNDRHGHTSHLTPGEIDDLVAYLQCL